LVPAGSPARRVSWAVSEASRQLLVSSRISTGSRVDDLDVECCGHNFHFAVWVAQVSGPLRICFVLIANRRF
jgi:hypothetical protein